MNLQAEITAVKVNADDVAEFTIQVADDEETAQVSFSTVVDSALAAFLIMRRDHKKPRDAFDQVVDAIDDLNFTSKLAEDLVGTVYTSTDE
jgi:hypothetical protein